MGERRDDVSFQAHVELLQLFLAHREEIVERIQGLLNAQRRPAQSLQDRSLLSRRLEDCFFRLAAVSDDRARLEGELDEAHRASGFRPRQDPRLHNDLIHPAEMAIRAFHCWRQTRWPGRNGRTRYAHTLFNVYVMRCLELLSMRVWDAATGSAGDRLAQAQSVLDALWKGTPGDQPAFVRDARWLIPLAQSPTTDELAGYFEVSARIAERFTKEDRVEIRKASVRMIAGHLRSQIRHYCMKEGLSLDEHSVVLRTRTSNALDFALLIQGLVPLLKAYESAARSGDEQNRLELASAVCQGISADPELFLNRVDLLGAYSMIEYLFVATDRDGEVAYTPTGERHLRLFEEYASLIGRLAQPLHDDCSRFRPVEGAYSPYGAIYGTPSNLTEDMALKTLERDAVTRFSLEDVFADGGADKLAWVRGWRELPHIPPEIQKLYEYPREFAEAIFDRIERALQRSAAGPDAGIRTGRLFILPGDGREAESTAPRTPALPARYIGSSDPQIVAALGAESHEQARLLRDRQEGYLAVSYETPGGWVGIRKDFLTEVLGAGQDIKIVGLPREAADVLCLMCPNLASEHAQ